jgi:hypothetical protein
MLYRQREAVSISQETTKDTIIQSMDEMQNYFVLKYIVRAEIAQAV